MTVDLDRLTVLGVRPTDSRLQGELWRFVPDEADAIYCSDFGAPSGRSILRGLGRNPPVVLGVLALLLFSRYHHGPTPPAERAVEALAYDRRLELVELPVDPLDRVLEQGPVWTAVGWLSTVLIVAVVALLVVQPGPLSVLVAFTAVALVVGIVLIHAGMHVQRRDDAITTALLEAARRERHRRPVVVVRERHVPGVSDRTKDQLISTETRTVSTDLTADASLY